MTTRWDCAVPCPRLVVVVDLEGGDAAECEGHVRVYGYDDPGSRYARNGDPGNPPDGEMNADACDTCGFGDWSDTELTKLTDEARDA